MSEIFLSGDQFILVNLLLQVGFMASLASLLITTRFYQRLLREEATRRRDATLFGLTFGLCLGVAVGMRFLAGYAGMDASLPGALLAGLLCGPVGGALVGFFVGGAGWTHGEWLALPFGLLYGLVGAAIWRFPGSRRGLWEYSPFPHVNVWKFMRARNRRDIVPLGISAVCVGLDVARHFTTKHFGTNLLWSFQPHHGYVLALAWVTSLVTIGVPLHLWNNTRLEMLLKSQEGLAVRARLDALTQQINPHFLFNTLTSISAATRRNPDLARDLIHKLSTILRRVLYRKALFVSFAEELDYIDSYLDLEVARFGPEKLRIVKDIEPEVRPLLVPSMILQPLVENAVNHAIAPRPAGGTVWIRALREGEHLAIEIEDDGTGFDVAKLDLDGNGPARPRRGIGLTNVHQRLKMAYGQGLVLRSARGQGTLVRLVLPCTTSAELVPEAEEKV
ncbi:MAG TPA: histidine kinase [Candidatus Krumholzibacteria bacterium]|nr:histidine kinase [Candidatus Krumholzibacteria bacterium]